MRPGLRGYKNKVEVCGLGRTPRPSLEATIDFLSTKRRVHCASGVHDKAIEALGGGNGLHCQSDGDIVGNRGWCKEVGGDCASAQTAARRTAEAARVEHTITSRATAVSKEVINWYLLL